MSNLESIFLIVEGIDRRTKRHTDLLEVIAESSKASGSSMEKIATNTEDMAGAFKELMKENRENISLIAGKGQVPMSIFLLVVILLSGVFILDRMSKGITFKASPSGGIEIQNVYESIEPDKSPNPAN